MADRLNLTNKVVTGGKFVATTGRKISVKESLLNVQASVATMDNADMSNYIMSILNDNVITPSEKTSLNTRWSSIRSSYYRLVANMEDAFGVESIPDIDDLRLMYSSLESQMSKIFDDMNTESKDIPTSFKANLEGFVTEITRLANDFSSALYEYTKYDVVLTTSKTEYEDDDTIRVEATLYYNGNEYTGGYRDINIEWFSSVDGIDLNQYKNGNIIEFSGSILTGSLTIDCAMELPIATPLPF